MEILCQYGCGKKANYQFKNGKWCCSKDFRSCEAIIEKINEQKRGKIPNWKNGHPRGMRGKKPFLKGKTYEEAFGEERSKEIREKISNGLIGISTGIASTPEKEEMRKDKIRKKTIKRYDDGWMPKAGRCKKILYESKICGNVSLDGTWELLLAEFLDNNNVDWKRNTKRFDYFFEDKWRHYTPDFYLPKINIYIEVKGYKTNMDEAKWNQFPETLFPMFKKEIMSIKRGEYTLKDFTEWWQNQALHLVANQ
jgi:hypothetical protein